MTTNATNWRPTQGVSSGEATQQVLFIEGSILFRNSSDAAWVRLKIVPDSENPGVYVFQVDTQSSDNTLPA